MKRNLLILITLLVACQGYGQWVVGPRAGVNFCTLTGKWNDDDDTRQKWIVGPIGGASAGYSFNELFSLNADLLYINMGQKAETSYEDASREFGSGTYSVKEYYNCFQMAVLAQIIFGTNINYFFFLGPFMTYKFGGCAVVDDGTGSQRLNLVWGTPPYRSIDEDYYVDPEYNKRWSHGIYLGGGVGKDAGPGKITVDFRFGIGLNDLTKFESKEDKKDARDNGYRPYRGLNAAITFAYLFQLGKK